MYAGADIANTPAKSRHHFTLVFNTFVYLQVFNQINARKVNNGQSALAALRARASEVADVCGQT